VILQFFPLDTIFHLKSLVTLIQKGLEWLQDIIERFVARAVPLYEQEPGEAFAPSRLGEYVE
jgi:hypothetical protein